MRVIFTEPALADVEDIREYLSAHYPFTMPSVERRIQVVLNHIASWPKSGRPVGRWCWPMWLRPRGVIRWMRPPPVQQFSRQTDTRRPGRRPELLCPSAFS